MSRNNRSIPEINAGSMADIAFLLLIFFLVTTTMDSDSGITIKLPPHIEDVPEPPPIKKKNVLEVLVNSNNQLLVEEKLMRVEQLRAMTKKFITNNGKDPDLSDNPQKAVVSLKNDRATSYKTYIQVQNELKAAYREVREEYARNKYGRTFDQLAVDKQNEIVEMFPQKISEAEPETVGQEK